METIVQQPDLDLIRSAQQGSNTAFEQLVYKYDRQVLTIAGRFVQTSDDAKDIYQDVFIRVYHGIKKFRFESDFSTWLHRITVNVCMTHVARKKRNPVLRHSGGGDEDDNDNHGEIPDTAGSPEELSHAIGIQERIAGGMEALSPNQRTAFTLKYIQDYSIKDIAAMMNCSEGNVKKHLFVATRRMREQLKDVKHS
jgi:RNA polymerase sigma-70 factor (ECF subfamily)